MAKHDSPVPLYVQIKEYILRNIRSGVYDVNERIPSERRLAEQFQVNRLTVSKAINELVQDGLLYTQVGKGTYVRPVKIDQTLQSLSSFTEDMTGRGKQASSRVLYAAVEPASDEVAKALGILPGVEVNVLSRLRMADDQLIAFERSHVIYALCPNLLEGRDFSSQSLYQVMREEYGIRLTYADQTIEAGVAEDEEIKVFGADTCTPILRITRVTHDENDRPVEYVQSSYHGDRYKFYTVLRQME